MVFGCSAIVAAGLSILVQLGQVLARSAPLHTALSNDVLTLALWRGRSMLAIGQRLRLGHLGGRGRLPDHGGGRSFRLRMSICGRGRHGCFWYAAVLEGDAVQ